MTNQNPSSTATATEPIFEIERTFNASRELVFDAWTDPLHLSNWWGPKCFACRCEVDLKVGGKYRFTMVGPDGVEYPMRGVYREIVRPERLVMTINVEDHPAEWHQAICANLPDKNTKLKEQVMTVTFEDVNGKTHMKVQTRFENVAERDAFVKIGMTEGWSQSLDKLAELIAKM